VEACGAQSWVLGQITPKPELANCSLLFREGSNVKSALLAWYLSNTELTDGMEA
jgi:hypothetical protein